MPDGSNDLDQYLESCGNTLYVRVATRTRRTRSRDRGYGNANGRGRGVAQHLALARLRGGRDRGRHCVGVRRVRVFTDYTPRGQVSSARGSAHRVA